MWLSVQSLCSTDMVDEPIKALQHIPCIIFALIMTFNDEILNFVTVLTKNLTSQWHDL